MALIVKDRVRETSTTTGTGTLTLAGAVAGFQSFSEIGDGNTTYYSIVDATNNAWEVGIGTYTASGTTLSRDTVLESSNAGALVNFSSGTKDVFCTYPAEKAVYNDATNTTALTNLFYTGTLTGSTGVINIGSGQIYKDASGNVGIGTSSPITGLECVNIAGAITGRSSKSPSVNSSFRLMGGAYTGNPATTILLDGVSGENRLYLGGGTGFGEPATEIRIHTGTAGSTGAGTERLRIDSSGNVGIGTSAPQNVLHINPPSDTYGLRIQRGPSDFQYLRIGMNNARATFVSTGYLTAKGGFEFSGSGTSAPDTLTEYMRIDPSGNLLIGKTAINNTVVGIENRPNGESFFTRSGSTGAETTLHVFSSGASAYRFYVDLAGTVFATNTTISAISDQRLKENVQDLDVGLDAVMALKPRKFDWKDGKGKNIKGDRGWIAQEFEQVFPDMIDQWRDSAPEGEEPYKSVRADLIPVLVKAMQELNAKVESLQAELNTLKGA